MLIAVGMYLNHWNAVRYKLKVWCVRVKINGWM